VLAGALILDIAAIAMFVAVADRPEILGTLDPWLFTLQLMFVAPFVVVGALVVARRPMNLVGRLLLLTGTLLAVFVASQAFLIWDRVDGQATQIGSAAMVVATATFYVMSGMVVPRLMLVIPDGQLPSPAWRPFALLQAAVAGLLIVSLFTPGDLDTGTRLANPLGIPALRPLDPFVIPVMSRFVDVLTVVAGASLIVRFLRARGLERSQLKLIAWAGTLAGVCLISNAVLSPIAPWTNPVTYATGGAAACLLPLAIGIAVLRYRLYEIDRLISRTIGWAIISGTLVAAFVALVFGFQALLAPLTGGNTLAVAGSTLVVAALFAPVRSRVQRAVDRRFDRSRYEGEQLLAAFGERLRDEVDLATIRADVLATVDAAVRPARAALWLREGPGS
jgi:hypothetical protein